MPSLNSRLCQGQTVGRVELEQGSLLKPSLVFSGAKTEGNASCAGRRRMARKHLSPAPPIPRSVSLLEFPHPKAKWKVNSMENPPSCSAKALDRPSRSFFVRKGRYCMFMGYESVQTQRKTWLQDE